MEVVQLDRFQLEGLLGSGSDYEVFAATDSLTGNQVVIKRPNPDYITRRLHLGIDRLTEQLVEVHRLLGASLPHVTRLVGYTELAPHDGYFGDQLKESYRALIEERANGVPLVSDIRDKFKGVPIGLPQNLFALHPLVPHPTQGAFIIHQQLLDVEEAFFNAGELLLDMRPQNVYFDPGEGSIKVIDIGTIPTQGAVAQGKVTVGNQPRDIHDFFVEMFKYYATPDTPPTDSSGYKEPGGMRNVPDFHLQLQSLVQAHHGSAHAGLREVAVTILEKVGKRGYASFQDFRQEFSQYLVLSQERNQNLPDLEDLVRGWDQALGMLSDSYWRNFLFDPDYDLDQYRRR